MLRRCLILLIILLIIPLTQGCNQKVTLDEIDKLIFIEVKEIDIDQDFSDLRTLNDQEIEILRSSIRNGKDLTELPNDSMPKLNPATLKTTYWFISVRKRNFKGIGIIYDHQNEYIYIRKIQIYSADQSRNVYGIYRFRPSLEIKKLNPNVIQ